MKLLTPMFLIAILSGCADRNWTANEMSGQWYGTARCVNDSGKLTCRQNLVIEVDEGGEIAGTIGWTLLPEKIEGQEDSRFGNNQIGAVVNQNREKIIGMASLHTGTFVLVECEEPGTLVGKLLGDGTIELLRTQPGEFPVVTFAILEREDD
jgi:transcriptional regulator GlxA family with amidase domain